MRILLDASALADARANAGIGRYVASLARELVALDGLEVRLVRPARAPLRESAPVRFLGAQPAIWKASRSWHPHLVHAPSSDPALLWPPRLQVVTLHDVIPWVNPEVRRFRATHAYLALQRKRLRAAGAVIAPSDVVAEEAATVLGISEARIHVVAEGVSADFSAQPAPDDHSLLRAAGAEPDGYILWVGSLRAHDPRKAIDVLLRALAGLGGQAPTLLMAGATGTESLRVTAFAEQLGVKTHLAGFVDDRTLAALYRGSVLTVIPSLHEGFGLPAIEAMACGAPLVAARAGNLERLAGGAAVLVEPGDVNDLKAAVERLLADRAQRESIGRKGPPVAARFSWRRAAEATAEVYIRTSSPH